MAAIAQGSATWTNCGTSSDKASGLSVSFSPKVLPAGAAYTYTTTYTLSETVTGGTIKNSVSLNGIPLKTTSADLCTQLKSGSTPCPLSGTEKSSKKGTIPKLSGKYGLKSQWTDQNGAPILCLDVTINM